MARRLASAAISALVSFLVIVAPVAALAAEPLSWRYGPYPIQALDLYLPASPGPHPTIILVHGGAWVSGDKSEMVRYSEALVARGIVIANIDYRLLDLTTGRNRWPAQLNDMRLAYTYVVDRAAKWQIDSNRICVGGESAGGHLALSLALAEPRIGCVIDLYGVISLESYAQAGGASIAETMASGLPLYRTNRLAAIRSISPAFYCTPAMAPTFIIQGSLDPVASPAISRVLYDCLRSFGVSTTLFEYRAGHVPLPPAHFRDVMDKVAVFIRASSAREPNPMSR